MQKHFYYKTNPDETNLTIKSSFFLWISYEVITVFDQIPTKPECGRRSFLVESHTQIETLAWLIQKYLTPSAFPFGTPREPSNNLNPEKISVAKMTTLLDQTFNFFFFFYLPDIMPNKYNEVSIS